MSSGSIVKQATAKARRTAGLALVGAALIVAGMVLDRTTYQRQQMSRPSSCSRAKGCRPDPARRRAPDDVGQHGGGDGRARWIHRYEANMPVIDAAIRAAIELAPAGVADRFDAETRVANDRLVELERASLEAVRAGPIESAPRAPRRRRLCRAQTHVQRGHPSFHRQRSRRRAGRARSGPAPRPRRHVPGGAGRGARRRSALARLKASLARSEAAFLEAESTIRDLALNDVLTGISNRRALRESLRSTLAGAARAGSKVALLMIDLDHFKPVNDRHGHVIGDLVLKEVAQRLSQVLREGELRARYGGDEFVAVVEYRSDDRIALRSAGA